MVIDIVDESATPSDRIALARELLPPGFVVAREVEELEWSPPTGGDAPAMTMQQVDGWNACRAAMMEPELTGSLAPKTPTGDAT